MELFVIATTASHFNCKLTPNRTTLLIIGYFHIYECIQIPIDLVRIIILYFNQLLYWKKKYCLSSEFQRKVHQLGLLIKPRRAFSISDVTLNCEWYDTYNYWKRSFPHRYLPSCSIMHGLEQVANTRPSTNNFTFVVSDKVSSINIKLTNAWHIISSIVIRVRVFCVENEIEVHKLLHITSQDKSMDICNYEQLQISHNFHNIGCEVEILHIQYIDNNYWSKWPYSWFNYIIDAKIFVEDNLSPIYVNYFNSRSFKVDNKYYYLVNSVEASLRFFQFIDKYYKQAQKLPFDIILLDSGLENGKYSSLFDYLNHNMDVLKKEHGEYEAQSRKTYENKLKKQRIKWNKKHCSMQYHRKRADKIHKTYRNNKRKYKYNRW